MLEVTRLSIRDLLFRHLQSRYCAEIIWSNRRVRERRTVRARSHRSRYHGLYVHGASVSALSYESSTCLLVGSVALTPCKFSPVRIG
jgi:hypothetical protein